MSKVLTRPQHALVQKLATHFKAPQNKVREDALVDQVGIVSFPWLDEYHSMNGKFYCSEGKFKLADLFDSKKFGKSKFYQDFLTFEDAIKLSGETEAYWAYYLGGSNILVTTTWFAGAPHPDRGDAYIFINHRNYDLKFGITVEPIKVFLNNHWLRESID